MGTGQGSESSLERPYSSSSNDTQDNNNNDRNNNSNGNVSKDSKMTSVSDLTDHRNTPSKRSVSADTPSGRSDSTDSKRSASADQKPRKLDLHRKKKSKSSFDVSEKHHDKRFHSASELPDYVNIDNFADNKKKKNNNYVNIGWAFQKPHKEKERILLE